MAEHLAQLLLDQLGAAVQALAELAAQLIDLLLDQQQRSVAAVFPQRGPQTREKNPADQYQAEEKKQDERQRG